MHVEATKTTFSEDAITRQIEIAVREHIFCFHKVFAVQDFAVGVTKMYLAIISEIRSDKLLQDIPQDLKDSIVEEVDTRIHAAYIASAQCPHDNEYLCSAEAIAQHVTMPNTSAKESCESIFQECYETTKTEEFTQAVTDFFEKPRPLLHAISAWREHGGSKKIEKFMLDYSKAMYKRRMTEVHLNIIF